MAKPGATSAASASPVDNPPDNQRDTQPAQQSGPPFKRHAPHAALWGAVTRFRCHATWWAATARSRALSSRPR